MYYISSGKKTGRLEATSQLPVESWYMRQEASVLLGNHVRQTHKGTYNRPLLKGAKEKEN